MDCFASLAMTTTSDVTSPFSRHGAPEVCMNVLPPKEGAGNAGCTLHPRSRVQRADRKTHTSIQVQSEHSGIPCAMALRLMPCSPRRRIRLASVAAGLRADRSGWIEFATDSLAPATGVGTTRFCRTRSAFAKRLRRVWYRPTKLWRIRESSAVRLARREPLMRFISPCDHFARPTLPRPPHPIPRP